MAKLLKANGYSLQANAKTIEGNQHDDRDAQFGYLNDDATAFGATGDRCSASTRRRSCDTRSHVASELAGQEGRLSVGGVVPGSARWPVPALACVAGNGGVRSSGFKPEGPRSIRGLQVRARPGGRIA